MLTILKLAITDSGMRYRPTGKLPLEQWAKQFMQTKLRMKERVHKTKIAIFLLLCLQGLIASLFASKTNPVF
jgi:hypothetical protein